MGDSSIRPADPRYMKSLRGKLEVAESKTWNRRVEVRRKKEDQRIRRLVIAGHTDPPPGMEDLYQHPVLRFSSTPFSLGKLLKDAVVDSFLHLTSHRANRLLERLSEIDHTMRTQGSYQVKLPPIIPVEPFEEYEATGLLFGSHPNHYLKKKRAAESRKSQMTGKMSGILNPPQFDADGKLIPPSRLVSRGNLVLSNSPPTRPQSATSTAGPRLRPQLSESFKADMEAAKKRYGINPDDTAAMWRSYESPLLKMINSEEVSRNPSTILTSE